MLAGKADVKGKGIIVMLRDNTDNDKNNDGRSDLLSLVHDVDISNIVNELLSVGAEAISVNDERLVATSEIKAAGPAIIINNNKISNTLKKKDGIGEQLQAFGDFANVEFMILKLDSKNIKKDSVSAQYEFKLDSEDSYTYLQLSMKKENDQWKIESYGLEK